jgi:hypothetical protein
MEVVHSPILECKTSLPPLFEWIPGAPPRDRLPCIFFHRSIVPFCLICLCISRWCFQWILETSDSSNAGVNEEDTPRPEKPRAHLSLDRNLGTIFSDTDLEGP